MSLAIDRGLDLCQLGVNIVRYAYAFGEKKKNSICRARLTSCDVVAPLRQDVARHYVTSCVTLLIENN